METSELTVDTTSPSDDEGSIHHQVEEQEEEFENGTLNESHGTNEDNNESPNDNTNEEVTTAEDISPQEEVIDYDEQQQEEETQPVGEEENSDTTSSSDQYNGEVENQSPKVEQEEMKPVISNPPKLSSQTSFKKKSVKATSNSLLTLPKWRQDLLQKNKEEIEFRNNLQNKYKTDIHGSVDGRLKKVDEIKSMKDSLSKTYTTLKKPAYEPEGKYVPPPKPQKKIEDDKLVFKKRFEYNSTKVKPILSEVSKISQKINKERELEKQRKLEEERKMANLKEEKRRKEIEEKRQLFKKLAEKKTPVSGEELHKQRVEKAREEKLKLKKKVEIVYPIYNPKQVSTPRERPQSAQVVEESKEKKHGTTLRPQTSQARNHKTRTQDKQKPGVKPVEEMKIDQVSSTKDKQKTSSSNVSKGMSTTLTREEVDVNDTENTVECVESTPNVEEEGSQTNSNPIQQVPEFSLEVSPSRTSPSIPKMVEQPSNTTPSKTLGIKKEIDDEESYIVDCPTEDCGDESSPLLTEDEIDFDLPLSKTPVKEKEEQSIASPQSFTLSPLINSTPKQEEDANTLFIRKLLSEIQSDEEESIASLQDCISSFGNQIFDKSLLSSEDYQTVFSGLQSIKSAKSSIVSDLKASLESKNFDQLFDSSNILMFKSVMLDYMGTLPSALQIVCQNMQTNDVFNYLNSQSQPRDLFFHLIEPVTCLQQQKGKLAELTEVLSTDSVNMFLSTITDIDDYRGDVFLENHTLFKVIELYKDLGIKELMNKRRFLVKEGIFKHENELHEIYLFGDCLVVKAPNKNWLIPFKVVDEILGDVNVVLTKYKEEKTLEIDEHDIGFHVSYQFDDYEDVKSWNKAFTSCFETLV